MKRSMMSFFLIKMALGTIMAITSKHWFLMWIGLETKTMSIMPMILSMQNRRKVEASMKYFLIQALAAAMILKSALMKMWEKGSWLIKSPMKNFSSIMITMALFFKLSMAPFHSWFPEVMKGTKLMKGLLMTTWQKMAPTMMMINMMKNLKTKMMILCSTMSMMIGSWKGLNQTQTRKMMAFSSMKHIGWVIIMSVYNPKMSLIMLSIYMMIKSTMFMKFMKKKTINLAKSKKKKLTKPWKASTTMLAILSLGGLPPLTGFMKKFLGMKTLMLKKKMILTMPLIMGSLMSLFFYLRMAFKTKMLTFPQKSLFYINLRMKSKKMKPMLSMISIAGIMMMPMMIMFMK